MGRLHHKSSVRDSIVNTLIPGVAVRMVEKHVDRIYTNFPDIEKKLSCSEKVMRVGNPLISENIVKAESSVRRQPRRISHKRARHRLSRKIRSIS